MDKKVLDYVVEKTNELISAPSCSSETKASAEEWLAAVGTDREAEATKKYIADLEGDIMPIDMLISFAESEAGAKVFGGAEAAAGVADHAKKIKADGAVYCDCPACAAVEKEASGPISRNRSRRRSSGRSLRRGHTRRRGWECSLPRS